MKWLPSMTKTLENISIVNSSNIIDDFDSHEDQLVQNQNEKSAQNSIKNYGCNMDPDFKSEKDDN